MAASRKLLPGKSVVAAAASLARHVQPQARLVLALSGGLDSVVLLHILLELRARHPFALRSVHVHHGLSPHADDWADFCARLCAAHAIDLCIHRVQLACNEPAGIEAAARRERRRIFGGLDADFLLTAHQQNDQAETLLLQLLRGAGPKGLASMAEVQTHPGWQARQLRPLLGVTRENLLEYARAHGLAWVEDESNRDPRYRRNALRHQVMPLFARHFPGSSASLARAAALQADTAGLLDDLARIDAQRAIDGDRLDCAVLAGLSVSRARNLLRYFIEQQQHPMPSARRLGEALHQLLDARPDARICMRLGEADLHRYRGGAYLAPAAPPWAAPIRWRGEACLRVPAAGVALRMDYVEGKGLRRDRLATGRVMLGVRQGGERLRLHVGGPRRSLKNLLQEHAIKPWQRDSLPLLWCDGQLLWAAGIGFDVDALTAPGEAGVLPGIVGPVGASVENTP